MVTYINTKFGAGQIAQWLGALPALIDLSLDPSTHTVAH